MKKNIIIALVAILLVAFVSCNNVDPIHGTQPVTNAFYTDANGNENFPLDRFHELGQAGDTVGQRALVDQYRKQLTSNVVRQYPRISDERNIHFILGSGFAKDVKSGDGKTHSGRFQNELIIILNDPSIHDTLFLACGNGMLSPLEFSDRHDFGNAEQWRFTIKEGESLATYLPTLTEWGRTAEDLGIPIKNQKNGNVVSSDTYLNNLGKWESVLFEGDVIDLLAGKVYNKAGQEVDFQRRLEESEKANAPKTKSNRPKGKRR